MIQPAFTALPEPVDELPVTVLRLADDRDIAFASWAEADEIQGATVDKTRRLFRAAERADARLALILSLLTKD
ncbi:hypothetical protein GCM10023079_30930 [Streptomyces chitinivorans]